MHRQFAGEWGISIYVISNRVVGPQRFQPVLLSSCHRLSLSRKNKRDNVKHMAYADFFVTLLCTTSTDANFSKTQKDNERWGIRSGVKSLIHDVYGELLHLVVIYELHTRWLLLPTFFCFIYFRNFQYIGRQKNRLKLTYLPNLNLHYFVTEIGKSSYS